MAKSVALGFGAAGAVVAAAVIAVVGSTVGFSSEEIGTGTEATSVLSTEFAPIGPSLDGAADPGNVVSSQVVTTASGEQIEYVYVDQPAARGHDDDDDDDDHEEGEDHEDHDDHDDHERGEHEDDD